MCERALVGSTKIHTCWAVEKSGVLCFFPVRRTSMGCYFKKGKGWRYDFTHRGNRYTGAWFRTKADAMRVMAQRKEELTAPKTTSNLQEAPTGMDFLEAINRRLDYVKAYHSATHYRDYVYMAKRWARLWGNMQCDQITQDMVERYLLSRRRQVICLHC